MLLSNNCMLMLLYTSQIAQFFCDRCATTRYGYAAARLVAHTSQIAQFFCGLRAVCGVFYAAVPDFIAVVGRRVRILGDCGWSCVPVHTFSQKFCENGCVCAVSGCGWGARTRARVVLRRLGLRLRLVWRMFGAFAACVLGICRVWSLFGGHLLGLDPVRRAFVRVGRR
jgi:hypothetical protein